MRKLRLTVNNDDAYKELMSFLKKFDETQICIEQEFVAPNSDSSLLDEPVVPYLTKLENDLEETESNSVHDDSVFLANKRYLEEVLERMDSGLAEYHTMEELEQKLSETLAKYGSAN